MALSHHHIYQTNFVKFLMVHRVRTVCQRKNQLYVRIYETLQEPQVRREKIEIKMKRNCNILKHTEKK